MEPPSMDLSSIQKEKRIFFVETVSLAELKKTNGAVLEFDLAGSPEALMNRINPRLPNTANDELAHNPKQSDLSGVYVRSISIIKGKVDEPCPPVILQPMYSKNIRGNLWPVKESKSSVRGVAMAIPGTPIQNEMIHRTPKEEVVNYADSMLGITRDKELNQKNLGHHPNYKDDYIVPKDHPVIKVLMSDPDNLKKANIKNLVEHEYEGDFLLNKKLVDHLIEALAVQMPSAIAIENAYAGDLKFKFVPANGVEWNAVDTMDQVRHNAKSDPKYMDKPFTVTFEFNVKYMLLSDFETLRESYMKQHLENEED